MAEDVPSQNTQWVACANANDALLKLASNLAAYLAETPTGRAVVSRLLTQSVETHDFAKNWTDLEPPAFDPDGAQRVALEMHGDAIRLIRRNALHEFG